MCLYKAEISLFARRWHQTGELEKWGINIHVHIPMSRK